MRNVLLVLFVTLVSLPNVACDKGLAYGDPNAVIVVSPEAWWPELEDSVFTVLAPDVFTLRTERTFRLTYQAPEGIEWQRLQKFKKLVLIGDTEEPWVTEVLATLEDTVTYDVPGLVQAEDVWAKGQHVSLILVDPSGDIPDQVFSQIDDVHAILEEKFREGVATRMFVSGVKESLVDSLREHAGFTLTLPEVYRWSVSDSFYTFRNDNPDPSELIREFVVTWRTPIPDGLTPDSLMDWKESLSQERYAYPQAVDRESLVDRNLSMGDMTITEVRGAWQNPPGSTWPAAGPFIFWGVECPAQNRFYYLDAWLYAPGKDKWEYILQLENILSSFRCGTDMRSRMGD